MQKKKSKVIFTAPINLYPDLKAASRHLKMVSRPLILNVPTE